jgi:hypothetical protein
MVNYVNKKADRQMDTPTTDLLTFNCKDVTMNTFGTEISQR